MLIFNRRNNILELNLSEVFNMNVGFKKAESVWLKGLETEKTVTMGLYTKVSGVNAVLKIATSGFYKVFLNGEFVSYGPARCAHGFFRVDEIEIALKNGENHIAIEVVNYYINSFASLMQEGFVQAELSVDGDIVAATGGEGFKTFKLNERVRKLQRFSYQRPAAESYRLTSDVHNWRVGKISSSAENFETEKTDEKRLLARGISPFKVHTTAVVKKHSVGRFITGVKPEKYYRDRALDGGGDPKKAESNGWHESEYEWHLYNEVQEWRIAEMTATEGDYIGETTVSAERFEILSLPIEKTGFITAEIECKQKGSLYFVVDETLRPNGDVSAISMQCCNVVRLDMDEGKYDFSTMEPFGFKYMKILATSGEFTVKNPRVIEVVCNEPIKARYNGNDKVLKKVFDAAVESFKQNSVDIFMDCPTRERAGWLCDSFFTAKTERALTLDNKIERNFLENFRLPERFEFLPDGMLPMCYPADALQGQFIPNWAMWFVLELEDYYIRNNDKAFIMPFKEKVYKLLKYFEKFENSDGLLEKLENWVFVEWSKANDFVQDINFPTNMIYCKVLKAVGNIFGDEVALKKAEKLAEVIKRRSFNGEFFTDNEVYRDGSPVSSGERSETCQYYAFFTDIATPEAYPELWSRLITDFGPDRKEKGLWPEIWPSNAFVGNYLRLELLRKYGLYEQLLHECVGYFEYMADRTGTLWENTYDKASCNHGFASYAAVFILEAEKHLNK